MLYAGDLRHAVQLQAMNEKADLGGGHTRDWTNIAAVHARISPVSGYERLLSGQMQSPMSHRITLRWMPGLTAKMRVLFGARVFNVTAVRNLDERNRWVELLCMEGVAQ